MKPTLATAIEAHYERVKRAHIMRYSGFGNYFALNESGDLPHTKKHEHRAPTILSKTPGTI